MAVCAMNMPCSLAAPVTLPSCTLPPEGMQKGEKERRELIAAMAAQKCVVDTPNPIPITSPVAMTSTGKPPSPASRRLSPPEKQIPADRKHPPLHRHFETLLCHCHPSHRFHQPRPAPTSSRTNLVPHQPRLAPTSSRTNLVPHQPRPAPTSSRTNLVSHQPRLAPTSSRTNLVPHQPRPAPTSSRTNLVPHQPRPAPTSSRTNLVPHQPRPAPTSSRTNLVPHQPRPAPTSSRTNLVPHQPRPAPTSSRTYCRPAPIAAPSLKPTWLGDVFHSELRRAVDVVAEGKEGVAAQRHVGHAQKEALCFVFCEKFRWL